MSRRVIVNGRTASDGIVPEQAVYRLHAVPAARSRYRPVCYFYARGYCRQGPACRYRHEPTTLPVRAPVVRKRRRTLIAVASPATTAASSGKSSAFVPLQMEEPEVAKGLVSTDGHATIAPESAPSKISASESTFVDETERLPPDARETTSALPSTPLEMTTSPTSTAVEVATESQAPAQPSSSATARRSAKTKLAVLECGICLENPGSKKGRFGLLTNCDHTFCASCIKKWRSDVPKFSATDDMASAYTHRKTCPLCRVRSDFIMPSFRFLVGDEKARALENYRTKCAELPCKYFHGDGQAITCQFGTACLYQHIRRNGTLVNKKVQAETAGKRAIPGRRRALRAWTLTAVGMQQYMTYPDAVSQEIGREMRRTMHNIGEDGGEVFETAFQNAVQQIKLENLSNDGTREMQLGNALDSLLSTYSESVVALTQQNHQEL